MESIVVGDVDANELLVGDRNAIMIAARISAYGNEYKATRRCGVCFHSQDHSFDLKKINYLDSCFDQKKLKKMGVAWNAEQQVYEYKLPKSGIKVGIQIPTGNDELLQNQIEANRIISETMKKLIYSVDGHCEEDVVSGFVENMLAWDSRSLREVIPNIFPNIELKQPVECKKCGSVEDREVPLTAEFFWPG